MRAASKAFLRALEKQRRVADGIEPRATWRLLFSSAMAVAVVAGRKTVTRRIDRRLLKAQPGDLLLGKETFAFGLVYDRRPPSGVGEDAKVHYLADGPKPEWAGKTRVSIHMPDWACRLRARIVSVREERLDAITEEDARAEGMIFHDGGGVGHSGWRRSPDHGVVFPAAREAFADLWKELHGAIRTDQRVVRVEFAPLAREGRS